MRRRDVLGGLAAAACLPSAVLAQKAALPAIGFLSLLPEASLRDQLAAFRAGLEETGYVIDRTVAVEYRWADGDSAKLPALAAELVRLQPALLVAAGGNIAAAAAKAATATIPIVFTAVRDPVQDGLVASLNRPGGNVTGVAILAEELDAKRLDLLHELAPSSGVMGAFINPKNPSAEVQRANLQAAARAIGRPLTVQQPGTADELDAAFATLAAQRATGLVVASDPWFTSQRWRIVELAARHRLPGIYQWRQFADAGGLASYGPNFNEAYRQAGVLAGRILRGENPATLPVLQPTRFELIINLRTAKTLGLPITALFMARADEVIE
ncbi:ABC transporter substrate-binding protein [Reyranella sp.]|uniref:ABC transporter substrate-binding protein n=1 Tax=Reyranella sp. TaxID=1929291 RepID=UPI002731489F|nr:ABC transporter substrate-binding protein [Reyranella sp.]MDP2378655.1 ABC transporter substrate-binding protein [Reyranella sp.]